MSFTTTLLKLTLQDLDDNPDTWGDVLNDSTLSLLENSIAAMADVNLLDATDKILDTTAGGTAATHYRKMILDINGTPGGDTNIIVPDLTGIYLAWDNTTGGDVITLKTSAGTGVALTTAAATWCYCDGTNVYGTVVDQAANATLAATATDALALGGVAPAAFAQIAVANTWTAGQVTERVPLSDVAGDITPDLDLSNSFYHLMLLGENLATPLNPTDGAMFSLVVEQGTGAPWSLTFQASTFIWEGGVAPTLSGVLGDIDYFAFEYVTGLDDLGGPRWLGAILKDMA